jgi:hypothetical protein
MHYLITTPEKWYYVADFDKIDQSIVYTADMENKSWSVSYLSGLTRSVFWADVKEKKEIPKEKFQQAKLKYQEYLNKVTYK